MNADDPLAELARLRRDDAPDAPALSRTARRILVATGLLAVAVSAGGAWWLTTSGGAELRDRLRVRYESWLVGQRAASLGAPGTSAEPVVVEVLPGEPIGALADRLEQLGLILDARAFVALAHSQGRDRKIQAGTHELRADMTADEALAALEVAAGDEVAITLPEGLRAEEIAERLAGAGLASREAFLALVAEPTGIMLPPIVAARPDGRSLEGYLFPDSYRFAPDAGAEAVLAQLVATFADRMGRALTPPGTVEGADGADEAAGAWSPIGEAGPRLSTDEVVTLASIVEREAALDAERPKIARVYLNRLAEAPYLLNADPTIQYALGFQPEPAPGTWWKRPLTYDDLAIASPYNSYTTGGLPPSPIASPGRAAIEAVLEPAEGDWQYFVADALACDGSHVFAVSYEEHLANVARFGAGECGG